MPLSQQIQDQIRKDAERYFNAATELSLYTNGKGGYIMGATAWAVWKEKADGYEKALNRIKNLYYSKPTNDSMPAQMTDIADKALEQFK